jgi:hypothetical protein
MNLSGPGVHVVLSVELGIVGISRMNHQLKRASVAESNGCEVTHVSRRQTTDAKRLGERDNRSIN